MDREEIEREIKYVVQEEAKTSLDRLRTYVVSMLRLAGTLSLGVVVVWYIFIGRAADDATAKRVNAYLDSVDLAELLGSRIDSQIVEPGNLGELFAEAVRGAWVPYEVVPKPSDAKGAETIQSVGVCVLRGYLPNVVGSSESSSRPYCSANKEGQDGRWRLEAKGAVCRFSCLPLGSQRVLGSGSQS